MQKAARQRTGFSLKVFSVCDVMKEKRKDTTAGIGLPFRGNMFFIFVYINYSNAFRVR